MKAAVKILLIVVGSIHFVFVSAQKKNEGYELAIQKTNSRVIIDGEATDDAWSKAAVARDFFMVLPMDTSMARVKTEVRMSYDNNMLYLLAICYNGKPGPYIV